MIIGLTGGIATGKSTVSKILKNYGAYIIDADKIAHEVLSKGEEAWKKVIDEFGEQVLNKNKEIDRKVLGEIVFSDKSKLRELEKITHPEIVKKIKKEIKSNKDKEGNIVLEAPLLFETGLEGLCDEIWVVYTDRETQVKRLLKRDKLSIKEAENRINSQMDLKKKKKKADRLLNNNKNIGNLKKRVDELWKKINKNT
ncbi:MAG: dephospho-CoA kinase [Halanaerobiales bacterium]